MNYIKLFVICVLSGLTVSLLTGIVIHKIRDKIEYKRFEKRMREVLIKKMEIQNQKEIEKMGRMSKKDMAELREFCSLGCDYSGTRETVDEIVTETLSELGSSTISADECTFEDMDGEAHGLDEFVDLFWKKAVEKIMNVVETQGK